jgi:hypothetical protein
MAEDARAAAAVTLSAVVAPVRCSGIVVARTMWPGLRETPSQQHRPTILVSASPAREQPNPGTQGLVPEPVSSPVTVLHQIFSFQGCVLTWFQLSQMAVSVVTTIVRGAALGARTGDCFLPTWSQLQRLQMTSVRWLGGGGSGHCIAPSQCVPSLRNIEGVSEGGW